MVAHAFELAERAGIDLGAIVAEKARVTAAAALKVPGIELDILVFDRQGTLKGRTASTPSHQPFASSFGERNRRT